MCVYLLVCVYLQSVISPSVETRLWREMRSVMWVTTTQTSAASALRSLWESSVDSGLAKSAGTIHVNIHTPSECA